MAQASAGSRARRRSAPPLLAVLVLTRINYGIGDEKWIATRLLGVVMRAQELDVQLLDRADQLVPARDWHDPAFTVS